MGISDEHVRWLLLVFSLPTTRATERVEIWRRVKRSGALPLGSAGYLLPMTPATHEKFEWLASSVRRYGGRASVVQVHAIDDLPHEDLVRRFAEARAKDYEAIARDVKKLGKRPAAPKLARLRKRFEEAAAVDFFDSPMRGRTEALLARAVQPDGAAVAQIRKKNEYRRRTWVTRPRPGIDRVSSAWLITRFIDPAATFAFAHDPKQAPGAVPFDMFQPGGFGHRGNDCTFETLRKEFRIGDARVGVIAEIVHDADLEDEKFGRPEGIALDKLLVGWAQRDVSDEELLRRGIEMIDGLYHSLK
jgi:hypothetical protein